MLSLTQKSGKKGRFAKVSFRDLDFEGKVPGFGPKDFATQENHVAMIEKSDGYVVF